MQEIKVVAPTQGWYSCKYPEIRKKSPLRANLKGFDECAAKGMCDTLVKSAALLVSAPSINSEYSLKHGYIQFKLYGLCAEDNVTS